jgi:hypothetical protein
MMAGPGRRKLVEYLQRVRPPASTIFHSCMLPHPTCPPNRLPATARLPPPTHRRALNHSCIAAASSAGHTKGLSRHRPPTHLPTPAHATGSMHLPRLRPPSARRLPRLQPPSALRLLQLRPLPGASPRLWSPRIIARRPGPPPPPFPSPDHHPLLFGTPSPQDSACH